MCTMQHQQKEPLFLHKVPDLPWSIIAADTFESHDKEYLVLVDSYSRWFEVDQLHNCTSTTIMTKLKRNFATHGVPQQLMTVNTKTFTSKEFEEVTRT